VKIATTGRTGRIEGIDHVAAMIAGLRCVSKLDGTGTRVDGMGSSASPPTEAADASRIDVEVGT